MSKPDKRDDLIDSTMSLGDHLEELRSRLILALAGLVVGLVICLCFGKQIIGFIKVPYLEVMGEEALLQTLAPAQGISSYVKISLISGLIISSPWVFYHIWMFVASGLYPKEKRYVHLAVPFSTVLFIAGTLFFLFVVAELSLSFLVKFDRWLGNEPKWTFPYYITFVSILMLVFGVAFQTPIAIFILNRTGLVSVSALRRSRKYAVMAIVIIAAMATPPDVVSQITLAIPLYLLYELGIILCTFSQRNKK